MAEEEDEAQQGTLELENARERLAHENVGLRSAADITVDGAAKSIKELLEMGDLDIPFFQRPYAWLPEHATRLVEDIDKTMKEAEKRSIKMKKFFGPVSLGVLLKGKADAFLILDGQQRITTFVLLIAVLRHRLHKLNQKHSKINLCNLCLFRTVQVGMDESVVPKFQPWTGERALFKRYVHTADPTELRALFGRPASGQAWASSGERRMVENMVEMNARLEELYGNDIEKLVGFIDFTFNNTLFSVVTTKNIRDESDLRSLFVSINDSGVRLEEEDILKAELLGRACTLTDAEQKQPQVEKDELLSKFASYQADWEKYATCLGLYRRVATTTKMDGFKLLFRTYAGIVDRNNDWISVVSPDGERESIASAREFVEKFLRHAACFHWILSCKIPNDELSKEFSSEESTAAVEKVQKILRLLALAPLKLTPNWLKLALLFVDTYRKDKLFPSLMEDLLRLLTAYTLENDNATVFKRFVDEALQTVRDDRSNSEVTSISEVGGNLREEIDRKCSNLSSFPVFCENMGSNSAQFRFALLVYQWIRSGFIPEVIDDFHVLEGKTSITIEHIFPKSYKRRTNDWPDSQGLKELLDRIGNLTLLHNGDQAEAGNNSFAHKKSCYRSSIHPITKSLAQLEQWNSETVSNRQDELIESFNKWLFGVDRIEIPRKSKHKGKVSVLVHFVPRCANQEIPVAEKDLEEWLHRCPASVLQAADRPGLSSTSRDIVVQAVRARQRSEADDPRTSEAASSSKNRKRSKLGSDN